jgi:antimicrobial peptide system SdpA family protein
LQILGTAALGLLIAAACLAAYAIHGSLPHNPIDLPFEEQLSTRAWAPEGWKFFTRNPREERPVLFVQRSGRWRRAETGPASRPRYLFGLDRAGRVQGLELGLIFEQIPRGAWRECDENPLACISSSAAAIPITNRSPKPTLCGSAGLALQKPIPWSWLELPRPVVMPSRIVRLEIRC